MKKILLILLILFLAIQFVRPSRNLSSSSQPNALHNKYDVEPAVKTILAKACWDCHSNNTRYPWYSHIQPVAWWLADHVKDGKRHFNYDEFLTYDVSDQDHSMEEVVETVKGKSMPIRSYTWGHSDARLTDEERSRLTTWAQSVREQITAKN